MNLHPITVLVLVILFSFAWCACFAKNPEKFIKEWWITILLTVMFVAILTRKV